MCANFLPFVMSGGMYEAMEGEHDVIYKNTSVNPDPKAEIILNQIYKNTKKNQEMYASLDIPIDSHNNVDQITTTVFFENDDEGPPKQFGMTLQCSNYRRGMPESSFHYFCTRLGSAYSLQSPQKLQAPVELQIQLGHNGQVYRPKRALKIFRADNFLPEVCDFHC